MSQTTTRAPSSAINSAMPRPMPRPAPVTIATLPSTMPGIPSLPPDVLSDFDNHPQLRPFLVFGQRIAFLGRSEAALRRQGELVEAGVLRRLFEPALDGVLAFELPGFRG